MTSGQNNIVVSEVGYCADDVNGGADCDGWPQEPSAQAARSLTEMLDNALPYHEAGWLRALLVYARSDGGWAMQLADGALTAQGKALQEFALSQPRAPRAAHSGPHADAFDSAPGVVNLTQPI
jgi:hypothetical protein